MRLPLAFFAIAMLTTGAAQAGSQSSNTSSDSQSNNGVVRERIVETYCEDGYCERYVQRRVYRNDWQPRRELRGYHDDDD